METPVLETRRLRLGLPGPEHAAFFLELLTDPDWHRFVGDPGVRDIAAAEAWVEEKLLGLHRRFGFTLYLVELKAVSIPIGICGLVKRDTLEHMDLGFGFLPAFRGRGYAKEASLACMEHARREFSCTTLLAITDSDNEASAGLLGSMGFHYEKDVRATDDGKTLRCFAVTLGGEQDDQQAPS
ncbi:MAG: GNAT family N-acetyltransferase [Planctomycetota bacterium]|jgi:RimJ/RimL family protein N-acetyltransferase